MNPTPDLSALTRTESQERLKAIITRLTAEIDHWVKHGGEDGEAFILDNAKTLLALSRWALEAKKKFDLIGYMETHEPQVVHDAVSMMANEAKDMSLHFPSL